MMEILSTLGINSSIFIQFILFVLSFLILKSFIFKPYLMAFQQRDKQTEGTVSEAENILVETEDLKAEYEQKTKKISQEIQAIFNKEKTEAEATAQKMLSDAKKETETRLLAQKNEIAQELQKAKTDLANELPSVSALVVERVLGRNI